MTEERHCLICGEARRHLVSGRLVRSSVADLIRAEHSDWADDSCICLDDLNLYRSRFVEKVLEVERGELSALEEDVIRSLREH